MQYQGLTLHERQGTYVFEDPALVATHDQKTGNLAKRDAFLQKYGLRLSTVSNASINYLFTGRASYKRGGYGGYSRKNLSDDKAEYPEAFGWFDHTKLLYHPTTRQYLITTQPYNLTLQKYQSLEQFCEERGLACRISYDEAWWYPGSTPLVVLGQRDTMAMIFGSQE